MAHGHYNYVVVQETNEITGELEDKKIIDPIKPYTQDDEDEYRIIILDNAANISTEKNYETLKKAIEKVSKDGIVAKKQLNYIFVLIQHQAQAQEGIENIKLGRMRPTSDGLGDAKTTSRDLNCLIGLYNPIKFLAETQQEIYEGYNIKKLSKHCRFLEVIEDRDYGAGGYQCGLFFDGATSTFKELPKTNDIEGLERYYSYIKSLESLEDNNTLQLTHPK